MGFAHRQGNVGSNAAATNITVTLGSAPIPGNLLVCGAVAANGTSSPPTISSVQDSNLNSFTVTPNSPESFEAITSGSVALYYLIAPANATASIKITISQTQFVYLDVEEFSFPGPIYFDVDVSGSGAGGTTINAPSSTPAQAGELQFFCASPNHTITSVNAPWTLASAITSGIACGYILSAASGATALNCTVNSAGAWDAMVAAFTASPAGWNTQQLEPRERIEVVGY